MKKIFLFFLLFICSIIIHAESVYVDSNTGDDNNPGTKESPVYSIHKAMEIIRSDDNELYTLKINPGIYILDKHVAVSAGKKMLKRIVIEAAVLPGDTSWTPEKMPVIKTVAKKGEIMKEELFIKDHWITSFYINQDHVTIRGLKFLGYDYPANLYYPISRFNEKKTDLIVEQCMFLGDLQSSAIQASVIAHGDSVKIDHCIFYNVNNAVIYWHDSGKGYKTGNSMTNCIVYGANGCAVWTDTPDQNYIFKNNIVSECNFVWINDAGTSGNYFMEDCAILNNKHFKGDGNLNPADFELKEINIIKEGTISLRRIKNVFEPWPIDHLHIIPDTPGYNFGAGLFKHKPQ